MAKKTQQSQSQNTDASTKRPPVVAILGHIDHGKSTLLDYIRKSHIVDSEAGGITQSISAYEVELPKADGSVEKITFIDTPGHEAFSGMRERGAGTADIALLIVSAEDGVKTQTLEAYREIEKAKVPFIVAINKIDKPNANIEKVKNSLAEAGVYLEGYGGNISYVPISAKTGQGIPELLEMILLTADISDLTGNSKIPGTGTIIEADRDPKKGISATLIIKNGSLRPGMFVASGTAFSPTRMIENHLGKKITEATFSSPVRLVGWNEAPRVGGLFESFESKHDLEEYLEAAHELLEHSKTNTQENNTENKKIIPVIIKADVLGSVEAIEHEMRKIKNDRVAVKVILSSIGSITESDVKGAGGNPETVIVGFNVKTDSQAQAMIERIGMQASNFDIIYKLVEFIQEKILERTPKVETEEIVGKAKILKCFSVNRDKQIVGGKVIDREINLGHKVKIYRRETIIGEGVIRELQQTKVKTNTVNEGFEFGTMIDSKIELAPGDVIEDFIIVSK